MQPVSFRSILVTTDLSPEATKAYPFARSLAERYSGQLTLLSCVDTSAEFGQAGIGAVEGIPLYTPQQTADRIKDLNEQVEEHARVHFSELAVSHQTVQGALPVERSIISFLAEHHTDLVVMASHGRTGVKRALLGSVTEYVVRHSSCPVLVVPTRH